MAGEQPSGSRCRRRRPAGEADWGALPLDLLHLVFTHLCRQLPPLNVREAGRLQAALGVNRHWRAAAHQVCRLSGAGWSCRRRPWVRSRQLPAGCKLPLNGSRSGAPCLQLHFPAVRCHLADGVLLPLLSLAGRGLRTAQLWLHNCGGGCLKDLFTAPRFRNVQRAFWDAVGAAPGGRLPCRVPCRVPCGRRRSAGSNHGQPAPSLQHARPCSPCTRLQVAPHARLLAGLPTCLDQRDLIRSCSASLEALHLHLAAGMPQASVGGPAWAALAALRELHITGEAYTLLDIQRLPPQLRQLRASAENMYCSMAVLLACPAASLAAREVYLVGGPWGGVYCC